MEQYRDYITGKKQLLSSSNAKLGKDDSVLIYGLSLLPHTMGGGANLCPHASEACKAVCLVYSGNARFAKVNIARERKTRFYLDKRSMFNTVLKAELARVNVLGILGEKVAVRLNVFSDIAWEKQINMGDFRNVQFYDYTKNPIRMDKYLKGQMPNNYHLTFSYSGDNLEECYDVLEKNGNVTIVFKLKKGQSLPKTWNGYRIIDGDVSDYRPDDAQGVVVGLKYKQPVANKEDTKDIREQFYIEL